MNADPHLAAFLDALAAGTATPGGGAAAALMAAMGGSLVSMGCRLTIGRPGREDVDGELRQRLEACEAVRRTLLQGAAEDAQAYQQVLDAGRLPRLTEEDRRARSAALQAALRAATWPLLECARGAAQVVCQSVRLVEIGHVNAVGDVAVGTLAAMAALQAAALNVSINTRQIDDRGFVDAALGEAEALVAECLPLAEGVQQRVMSRIG